MPKLISSALKYKPMGCEYYQIACGKHQNDIELMLERYQVNYERSTAIVGFMTDEDQFVDRYDAYYIALMNQQIQCPVDKFYRQALHSSDIW